MKVRESGMPEEQLWNSFFNVDEILKKIEISQDYRKVVEIGTGYGTFTQPVAKKISGTLVSYDIENDMLECAKKKCQVSNIRNVVFSNTDVLKKGTALPGNSVDYVMLFNILHNEKPLDFLNEAKRILKPKGKIGILHWRTDIETPRGPSLEIRSTPEDILKWIEHAGLTVTKGPFNLKPFHFGILASKQ